MTRLIAAVVALLVTAVLIGAAAFVYSWIAGGLATPGFLQSPAFVRGAVIAAVILAIPLLLLRRGVRRRRDD